MPKKITLSDLESAAAGVRAQWGVTDPADGPIVDMEFDWFGGSPTPSLIWEGGPYGWPSLASMGGFTEFGREMQPVEMPANVWAEATTHFALALYPAESVVYRLV